MQKGPLLGQWLERNKRAPAFEVKETCASTKFQARHCLSFLLLFPSAVKWAQHARVVRGGDKTEEHMMACDWSGSLVSLLSFTIQNPIWSRGKAPGETLSQ